MSRRRGRTEGIVNEANENSPVLRKSARIAEKKIPKIVNTPINKPSARKGVAPKAQGRPSTSRMVEKEDHTMEVEEPLQEKKQKKKNEKKPLVEAMEIDEHIEKSGPLVLLESDDEEEDSIAKEKQTGQSEMAAEDDMEQDHQPDLQNGLCAYMKLLERVVRIPEPERALFSKQGLELLNLGDTMHSLKVQFDGITVTKAAVTMATTLIHTNQLLKLSHSPMFMDSILRWEPITEREIGYLIYMLARIKCPQINPECFANVEELLKKYTPNEDWKRVWNVISKIEIANLYQKDYKGKGPLFEEADYFSENMFPSEGNTYMNTLYFLLVFKERLDAGVLVF